MPAAPLFDLAGVDLNRVAVSREEIEVINPQRYEFQQLTHVCYLEPSEKIIIGVRDLQEQEFWVRGHMPGRPLFPGVLMIEAAAQLCSVYTVKVTGEVMGTHAFGGVDDVRFRRMVTVGDRLVIVAKAVIVKPSRSRYRTQGFVNGDLAFEASVFGITLPVIDH